MGILEGSIVGNIVCVGILEGSIVGSVVCVEIFEGSIVGGVVCVEIFEVSDKNLLELESNSELLNLFKLSIACNASLISF